MAAIVELYNDENGIVWPEIVAPFKLYLLGIGLEDDTVKKRAEGVYKELVESGVEVLYDDREDVTAGEKFADADLIGCPYRLVVSKKTGDKVEVKKRNSEITKITTTEDLTKKLSSF